MKEIAIEDLMADTILQFCENAAELGCPRDKEVDVWFREIEHPEQHKVCGKLLDIMERNRKKYEEKPMSEPKTDDGVAVSLLAASMALKEYLESPARVISCPTFDIPDEIWMPFADAVEAEDSKANAIANNFP
jgi:hypothetical protein